MEVDVVVSGSKAIEISFETKVIGSLKAPDSALSTTSENSVQNKVITEGLNEILSVVCSLDFNNDFNNDFTTGM